MPENQVAPQPRSAVDNAPLSAPRSPLLRMKKKMTHAEWSRYMQFVKPYFYTLEELETSGTMINSFRVPKTGTPTQPGITRRGTIKTTRGTDFEAVKIMCVAFAADGSYQNHFSIKIAEAGSDNIVMNYPVHMLTMVGTGQFPFILPCSLVLKEATNLTVEFTLHVTSVTYIYFTLGGTKYYLEGLGSITNRPLD